MKVCTKCGECKAPEGFHAHPSGKDGLRSHCRVCRQAAFSVWRKSDPEAWAERQRAWREANPEKNASYHRAAGYAAQKRWTRNNPERIAEYEAARRARQIQATPPWADAEKIRGVYLLAAQYRALGLDVDVDHVVPLQGKAVCGLHVETNLEVRLAADNRRKHNKFTV